jgi:hypothetical protein
LVIVEIEGVALKVLALAPLELQPISSIDAGFASFLGLLTGARK